MVRQYGKGEFKPGIFFTVKGKMTSDGAVEFDFRDVMYREVTSYKGSKKNAATGKYASDKKKPNPWHFKRKPIEEKVTKL